MLCDACGQAAELVDAYELDNHPYSRLARCAWRCTNCPAWVLCEAGTWCPQGPMVTPELRKARRQAHKALDVFWREGYATKTEAFHWLTVTMQKTSVSDLTLTQCATLLAAIDAFKAARGET